MNETDPYTLPTTLIASKNERPKRPVIVTVICILLVLGTIIALITVGRDWTRRIAAWYPAYNASYVLLQAICAFGMWLMKRWGFMGFVCLVAANLAVHFALAQWSLIGIGIQVVICFFLSSAVDGSVTTQL